MSRGMYMAWHIVLSLVTALALTIYGRPGYGMIVLGTIVIIDQCHDIIACPRCKRFPCRCPDIVRKVFARIK